MLMMMHRGGQCQFQQRREDLGPQQQQQTVERGWSQQSRLLQQQ
jgi:hypothetical protein